MSMTIEIDIQNLQRLVAYRRRRLEHTNGSETVDQDEICDRVIQAMHRHADRFDWTPETRRLAEMHMRASLASGRTPTQALMYAAESGMRAKQAMASARQIRSRA